MKGTIAGDVRQGGRDLNRTRLAQRIRRALRDEGLNVHQAALELGLGYATVQAWAKGDSVPRLDHAADFAVLTGVSLDWLAGID